MFQGSTNTKINIRIQIIPQRVDHCLYHYPQKYWNQNCLFSSNSNKSFPLVLLPDLLDALNYKLTRYKTPFFALNAASLLILYVNYDKLQILDHYYMQLIYFDVIN